MAAETEWYPEKGFLRWYVTRRLWSNFAGSAYEVDKDRKKRWRRYWTRDKAQHRADELNAQEQPR